MDGGDSDKEEDWAAGLPPSLAGVKLIDAPVLFLVVSHKAFRAELASVRRVAAEAAESEGGYSREVVVDLGRRLDFLKLAYSYHTAAEDEVIFLALDAHVKNVVATYSLEHKSIDDKFSSIFLHLNLLMNSDEDAPQIFQDLLFSIGTVQTMICQHMQKEEQQVFPLLTKKFTSEEQSQLVWQYMCNVPIILLEDFLPWMSFHLSFDERIEVLHFIRHIIPKERLLLEVVVSLLEHRERSSSEAYDIYGKGYQILNVLSGSKDIIKLFPPQIQCQQLKEEGPVQSNWVEGPIKGIYHWHAALRRDLGQIIEELYEIRSSNSLASLSSVIVHLKFIADVLIYYSNSLDKFFYPLLSQLAKNSLSPWRQLIDENQIKFLQRFLFHKLQGSAQLRSFMEMLYKELETLVKGFSMNLSFLETEVFPFISNNCSREMQLWLLYTCLHVMPLGLLRCTVTWFSAQLPENQSCSILDVVKVGCPAVNKSFTSLLYEWVRIGCSGKTSTARFRQNLEEMFSGRSFYLSEHIRPMAIFSDELESSSALEMPQSLTISSSSVPVTTEEPMSYPNGMNLHVFFSQMFKRIPHLDNNQAEHSHASFPTLELRPMDHILYIHRALSKDLEYLVSLSAKLTANIGLLLEFKKRFKLFRNIYQIHSISEDEIAFPALESKRALQNVSHSYSIEHKLEVKQFEKASQVLTEICELHDVGSKETTLKHYQLCLKLHDTCLSMRTVLSDHICREEVEIFSLFRVYFSIEEEEKIIGNMLGIIGAEILQEMIPWLMAYLTSDEQQAITSLWLKVARYTKFGDWLREWWEDMTRYNLSKVEEGSKPSPALAADPLEVVLLYLLKDGKQTQKDEHDRGAIKEFDFDSFKNSGFYNVDREALSHGDQGGCQSQEVSLYSSEVDKKGSIETKDRSHDAEAELERKECQKSNHREHPLCMNQEELEATIRRVSRDSTLDSQKKSYIIQNLLMSQWLITQKMSSEAAAENDKGEIPGQFPSYRDPLKLTFGCKHYKRNNKLLAPCCNKLYTCIRCHDDLTDHVLDRKSVTKMMCMKCLVIQPIGPKCMNKACHDFSMGKYYCQICKLFDDERKIYHCPYCNLCRVGKGLGIDYFHCMKCNACMSRSLFVHVCREKCLEDNCPICHEYIFTSNSPVKALPCGHLMHSTCFQDYTCSHYICPVCSKSLGDMQVYFGMLDALLAEEKIPEEYSAQIQVILCNDCEKRGTASFHWLYHKCPHCGSYNTRLL